MVKKYEEYSASLRRIATRTTDAREFGKLVAQQAFRAAAEIYESGKVDGDEVGVTLKFRVRPVPPKPPVPHPDPGDDPGPSEKDAICWEVGGGLRTYIECESPDLPGGPAKEPLPCQRLRDELDHAQSSQERLSVLIRMMAAGCSLDLVYHTLRGIYRDFV